HAEDIRGEVLPRLRVAGPHAHVSELRDASHDLLLRGWVVIQPPSDLVSDRQASLFRLMPWTRWPPAGAIRYPRPDRRRGRRPGPMVRWGAARTRCSVICSSCGTRPTSRFRSHPSPTNNRLVRAGRPPVTVAVRPDSRRRPTTHDVNPSVVRRHRRGLARNGPMANCRNLSFPDAGG